MLLDGICNELTSHYVYVYIFELIHANMSHFFGSVHNPKVQLKPLKDE